MKKLTNQLTVFLSAGLLLVGCAEPEENNKAAVNEEVDATPSYDFNPPQVIQEIKIGEQIWSTENLRVNKFRNGDLIPEAKTDEAWEKAALEGTPAWCVYDNEAENGDRYGVLYNWHAIHDPRGLAPTGWHIPSVPDWTQLASFLGGYDNMGEKMKSTTGWSDDGNGTNESGFNGLPGGVRDSDGDFHRGGVWGYWWSVTDEDEHFLVYTIFSDMKSLVRHPHEKGDGASVRVMKGDRPIAVGTSE